MKKYLVGIRSALLFSLMMLVLCGFAYPLLLTGAAQAIFPHQANGSIVEVDGKAVGSKIVGQSFEDERFFKGRPSAVNYNTYTKEEKADGTYGGVASGSNNYAPSNPELSKRVKKDLEAFMKANPDIDKKDIPADLITASGSGLDPDITPEAAKVQIPAIAKASGLSEAELQKIVDDNTEGKWLGVFGETRVNVLLCNVAIAQKLEILK